MTPVALVALTALATPLSDGWYAWERDRYVEASEIAKERLATDVDDVAAHRLYIRVQIDRGDRDLVEKQYRRWLDEGPEEPVRRLALGFLLASKNRRHGDWCVEAEGLLAGADQPAHRYWALRALQTVRETCEGDVDAVKADLIALGDTYPDAWGYAWTLRAQSGEWTAAGATDVARVLSAEPARFAAVGEALFKGEATGKWRDKAEKKATNLARKALTGSDASAAWYARRYAAYAEDPDLQDLADRAIARLDPIPERPDAGDRELVDEVYQANRKPSHEAALAALNELDGKVGATGPARAALEQLRSGRLTELGQEAEGFAALKRAYEADSDNPGLANEFAYEASNRGEELDLAVTAIEAAIEKIRARTYDPKRSYEAWRNGHLSTVSAYLDTKGWVLFKAGKLDEAIAAFDEALLAAPGGEQHAHLGLVHIANQSADLAFRHLVEGLRLGLSEPGLDDDVRAALEPMWAERGYWHPAGFDGWIDTLQAPDLDAPEAKSERTHALLGQAFPITDYELIGGGDASLADADGILVVDMWATWCGPCVAGMPHLQEVAEHYADKGVTVVGLSVDDDIRKVDRFFKGSPQPAYTVGFVGDGAFRTAKISGIPALFVLDTEHHIYRFISGYGGSGDKRLEEALDELIESSGD